MGSTQSHLSSVTLKQFWQPVTLPVFPLSPYKQQEQQNADEEATKNSAWKAYLAEVKAYEERTCTDQDGHKRPLVK